MKMFFVILAAGKSRRFNSKIPKQFNFYKGKMVLEHSVDMAIKSKLFKKVILVINKSHKKFIKKINKKNLKIIYGDSERAGSSLLLPSSHPRKSKSPASESTKTVSPVRPAA